MQNDEQTNASWQRLQAGSTLTKLTSNIKSF